MTELAVSPMGELAVLTRGGARGACQGRGLVAKPVGEPGAVQGWGGCQQMARTGGGMGKRWLGRVEGWEKAMARDGTGVQKRGETRSGARRYAEKERGQDLGNLENLNYNLHSFFVPRSSSHTCWDCSSEMFGALRAILSESPCGS